jgi:hypothetical protein
MAPPSRHINPDQEKHKPIQQKVVHLAAAANLVVVISYCHDPKGFIFFLDHGFYNARVKG